MAGRRGRGWQCVTLVGVLLLAAIEVVLPDAAAAGSSTPSVWTAQSQLTDFGGSAIPANGPGPLTVVYGAPPAVVFRELGPSGWSPQTTIVDDASPVLPHVAASV